MKHLSRLSLAVWILALAASGGACAQPTPIPTQEPTPWVVTVEVEVCPGGCICTAEAWIDQNGNGKRDSEDGPLAGVRFRVVGYGNNHEQVETWTSDETGYHEYFMVGCTCPCFDAVIQAEPPPGYRLTTQGRSKGASVFGFAPP